MQTLQLFNNPRYSQLSIISFASILLWIIFSVFFFSTNPSDDASGSIVAKLEFVTQVATLFALFKLYQDARKELDKKNFKLLQYLIAINLWLLFVDLFFYIAPYANDSLLQHLSSIYFLLYYAPCIIFALSMVTFLYKILIKNTLLANGFVKRMLILIIVDCIIFTFFLSSIHYAYTIFSLKNILQIVLLLTEFILFNIAIIGLIYAKNISAFLFLSGIIILVSGDFFITYTYIAQTTTLFFLGELFWFLGLIALMLTAFSIKENKHYFFNEWFRSDNAVRSRLGFGVFLTSISGFLIAFIISYLCGLIGKQVFLVFPPFIMLYSIIVVALSVLIAKSFESPFKKMENNINSLMINNDKNNIDNNFAVDEFVKLQDFLTNAFDIREEKDKVKKIFGEVAAKIAHDVNSPMSIMTIVIHDLKKTTIDNEQINLLESSMINIKNIMSKLLESYRSLEADNKQKDQDNVAPDDLSIPRFIIVSKMLESVIESKRIEWNSTPCNLSFNVEESCKNLWTYLSPIEITRTLSNLLNNAYESLKNETRNIIVSLTIDDSNRQNFLLTIEDSGIGILPEQIDAVKNGVSLKHAGKGLGLVNSIKYFESLHGKLTLESKPNLGTKVSIYFPIISAPNYLPDTIYYKNNCVFIILDDDPTIGMLWLHILKAHQLDCKIYFTVKEFDDWYNTRSDQQEFILLCDYDLHDEEFNGIDVIKNYNLKDQSYLMTSYAETAWMQELVRDNGIRLISKTLIEGLQFNSIT